MSSELPVRVALALPDVTQPEGPLTPPHVPAMQGTGSSAASAGGIQAAIVTAAAKPALPRRSERARARAASCRIRATVRATGEELIVREESMASIKIRSAPENESAYRPTARARCP